MKHQICRTVLAVAAVAAGVYLSACGLFRDASDDVFDDAEDAIATDQVASNVKTARIEYEFGDGKTSIVRFRAPEDVRIDVLDGENSGVFCLNGDSGWMFVGGEVIDMTRDDIKEMHGILLQTIPFRVEFQDIFTDAELDDVRVVSSAYLRLLIFLPAILIPACALSSPAFLMMYSACTLR